MSWKFCWGSVSVCCAQVSVSWKTIPCQTTKRKSVKHWPFWQGIFVADAIMVTTWRKSNNIVKRLWYDFTFFLSSLSEKACSQLKTNARVVHTYEGDNINAAKVTLRCSPWQYFPNGAPERNVTCTTEGKWVPSDLNCGKLCIQKESTWVSKI